MTPAQFIVNHCIETLPMMTFEQRVILLRSLAVEISDGALADQCREHAADLERADTSQRKLLLVTTASRAAT